MPLGVSYFLWYFTSFTTEYLLVFAVALYHARILLWSITTTGKVTRYKRFYCYQFLGYGVCKGFSLMCGAYASFFTLSEGTCVTSDLA